MEKQTWFFTSGIDQGVTKMIASAVEGYRWEISDIKNVLFFINTYCKVLIIFSLS